MDPERFQKLRAALRQTEQQGIGTLGEKTLHGLLKAYFQPNPACQEVAVGSFVADAVRDDGIIEIQTRSLYRLRTKLQYYLPLYPVTVVYPVAAIKWLIWVNESGECSPRRKSPRSPQGGQVLAELYGLRDLLTHPHFHLCVILLEVEDYRLLNGWSRDRKRGSTRFDRVPLSLLGEIWIRSPEEYWKLLPPDLPMPFTAGELGKAVGLSPKKASLGANVLWTLGTVQRVGKRGNAYLYTVKTNQPSAADPSPVPVEKET